MLCRLKITNFILIEQLELDFHSGLTVVTGETGSGKSIIIDALMLLFGSKAPKDIVRKNNTQASFEATFTVSNSQAIIWLQDNDLVDTDNPNEIICRRIIDNTGKSKIYINGNTVTSSQVKVLGEYVLDIHTQHASVTLLKNEVQRNLLDEYADITTDSERLSELFKQLTLLEHKLATINKKSQELNIHRQILNSSIEELSSLNLQIGEWEELGIRHKQLANSGFILSELDFIANILQNQDNAIIYNITKVQSRLDKISNQIPDGEQLLTLANGIEIELQELVHLITTIATKIEQDPQSLEVIEKRINNIFDLSRKYRILPEQIVDTLTSWQLELESLNQDIDIPTLEATLIEIKAQYLTLAKQISAKRTIAAVELSTKVTQLLHQLAISGEFRVALLPQNYNTSYGFENIEYLVGFNKGMPIQSMSKIVSGGELSRTALALYLLLSVHNPPEVIIFDEVDVGIGGKIAAIVGEMLGKLGMVKQVICITHQPQAAVFADKHLVVSKHQNNEISIAQVNYVEGDTRINEIARMLSGVTLTKTTLDHATEMLNNASKNKEEEK